MSSDLLMFFIGKSIINYDILFIDEYVTNNYLGRVVVHDIIYLIVQFLNICTEFRFRK